GLEVTTLRKVQEGSPNIVELMRRGEVALVVNTPSGAESYRDSFPIRRTALERRVPYFTTIAAAAAAAAGIETIVGGPGMVRSLQEHDGKDRTRCPLAAARSPSCWTRSRRRSSTWPPTGSAKRRAPACRSARSPNGWRAPGRRRRREWTARWRS